MLVEFGAVNARQAGVQHVFDGKFELRASRGLLPPVQDKQLLEPGQEYPGGLLYLAALRCAQLRRRAREDIEDDQFFLAHVLADVALLFLGQVAAQL